MAAPVCQFVDRVGTGAVQRLNLNDGQNFRLLHGPDFRPGPDFSPPALKRAVVNTLMAEGASIPASAYDNRIIRLPLRLTACDEAEMGTMLESLHRELDRGNNILKWHPTYNFRPVYFRTFRSPDYKMDQDLEPGDLRTTLALVAEPFAYGDYVEQTGTVYNDPAAVANGIHFEIAAVEGDTPTPLWLHLQHQTPLGREYFMGVRRHGTPALYWAQCEAMALGANCALPGNDATMSGAGNNYVNCTFADGLYSWRLQWAPCPGAGTNANYRGRYRLFVRIRRNGFTGAIRLYAQVGVTSYPEITAPGVTENLLDMGLVSFPSAPDPVNAGYGTVMPVENTTLWIYGIRDAGGDTIDFDYAVLVPADEELCISNFEQYGAAYPDYVLDGPNDVIVYSDMTEVTHYSPVPYLGKIPLVAPNQTNLYVVLCGNTGNIIAHQNDYTARYWPRHLYIR